MSNALVLVEQTNGIATVTLNRPEALNAISTALRGELFQILETLKKDDSVRVIILTGAGRAFSAGVDLKELGKGTATTVEDAEKVRAAFENFGKPIIGAINGFAVTGGFEMALMCDILIATPNAKFADTHARIGLVSGWGMTQRLPRLIGINRAKELSLTGNFLNAEKAEEWGLVNRIVPAEELLPTCQKIAEDIASCDPNALSAIKTIMDEGWNTTLEDGLKIENKAYRKYKESVASSDIENRRKNVMNRGRSQS